MTEGEEGAGRQELRAQPTPRFDPDQAEAARVQDGPAHDSVGLGRYNSLTATSRPAARLSATASVNSM
jgi:hypothetical protein